MSDYRYGWDGSNKKKVYMGKYANATSRGQGYFGGNEASTPQQFNPNDAGVKREFIGSGTRTFVFYSESKGMLTVRAESFEEAWRLAKNKGYSKRNYMR